MTLLTVLTQCSFTGFKGLGCLREFRFDGFDWLGVSSGFCFACFCGWACGVFCRLLSCLWLAVSLVWDDFFALCTLWFGVVLVGGCGVACGGFAISVWRFALLFGLWYSCVFRWLLSLLVVRVSSLQFGFAGLFVIWWKCFGG